MKNYCALVVNDVVTEIIVADYSWATANLDGEWRDLGSEPLTVAVGDVWDGTKFSTPIRGEPI